MVLDTQSTDIKDYAELNGTIAIFSSGGVDLYQKTYSAWVRTGFASLPNVTSGAFNLNGLWLGTSDRGVWHLPPGTGNLTSLLRKYYATIGTSFFIQSDNISHVAGNGSSLLVTHDAGAEYFPAPGVPFQYTDAGGCGACDVNDTAISYAVSSGLHTLDIPSSDWVAGDALILTTSSSPPLSSNTVNHIQYGLTDSLFIATASGIDVYDRGESLGSELATGTDSDMSGPNNWSGANLGTFDVNTTVAEKLYMKGDGGTDAASLDVLTATKIYLVSMKIKNTTVGGGSGSSVPFRIGGNITGTENLDYFEVTPTSIEETYIGFFTRSVSNTTLNVGNVDGAIDGEAFEVDDVSIKEYSTFNLASGNVPFVWPSPIAERASGDIAYVDSIADVHIFNLDTSSNVETHSGDFSSCWIDVQADLALYDSELERHAFISNVSPSGGARDVTRSWSIYFEIGDTINGLSSDDITLKVDGIVVSPTITSLGSGFSSGFSSGFGSEGFVVTYTPPSASGFRKTVTVALIAVDGSGDTFSQSASFTTETALNDNPSATSPPNVIVYKDLSLTDAEDTFKGVNVNWLDEVVTGFIVDEDQANAMATVMVENGIYHKVIIPIRVLDTDDSSNATQGISRGDIITIDAPAIDLTNQKCEVLAKQRDVSGDRIEYNLIVAYYVVFS
jgi:hypothetical protein